MPDSAVVEVPMIFKALLIILPMIVLAFLAVTVYCYMSSSGRTTLTRGHKMSTKDRIWRRFQNATRDLYPSLDDQERL
eukprot:CAMPEP_0176460644 /NCGR_PEP_ID=MMETSP0127-20121128/34107_1 /TAXON_ID=938130 /ORGANISM="Platyophrya macrostoma, Strain WH" /LENGTH=77 /DNA_ID=CAMNT_0017852035 /DNA_START=5 /DNA_END=234 /DNA_ORIENTATION=+